ncbi:MAG: transporter substrate-binding domain-containing protein, partial [Enterococcus sp.]|nr:transporter substrate-binding domain-containing protein [Enterococcus sp.]
KEKIVIGYDKSNFTAEQGFTDSSDYKFFIKDTLDILGWDAEFKGLEFSEVEKSINDGIIDCYWNSYTIQGRESKYAWTDAYKKARISLIYKLENRDFGVSEQVVDISTLSKLPSGKVIGVKSGTMTYAYMSSEQKKMLESIGTFKEYSGYAQLKDALNEGQIDMVLVENSLISPIFDGGEFGWVKFDTAGTNNYGVAFKKGCDEKAKVVTNAMRNVYNSGTLKKNFYSVYQNSGFDNAYLEKSWQRFEEDWLLK